MDIGKKLKELRLQKNLTQEELGERTDLTKGYISQLENGFSSPSMETFFDILEVLGTTPKDFFDPDSSAQQIVYTKKDVTIFKDDDKGFSTSWLVPDSNDKEMEPVMLTLEPEGEFKQYPPSLSETFGYVLKGAVELQLGEEIYPIKKGQSFYFEASEFHQLRNASSMQSRILLVVTDSYL